MSLKVSIITATYNSANTLEMCMDSVLNQSYNNIEYLIIDGNSTDDTKALIKAKSEKNPNIKWTSEPDKGIYDALNKGIAAASGDIIGFVHSDDFLANSSVIEMIVTNFDANDADGVYGDLHYVSVTDTSKVVRNWKSQVFLPKLLHRGWMPAHPTLFLKQEVYKSFGNFDLGYRIAADYDFILRIFSNPSYKFQYLPETIVKMRVGGESNRSINNLIKKTKEDYKAAKQNGLSFPFFVILSKNLSKLPQWLKK